MVAHVLKASQGRRWGVFNRIAVFATAPVATFLTLLLELLLGFCVGESKEQLDTIMVGEGGVVFFDDTFGNLPTFEPGKVSVKKKIMWKIKSTWQSRPLC